MTGTHSLTDGQYRFALVALMLVVVCAGLAYVRVSPTHIVVGTDAPQYDLIARNLAQDRGLSMDPEPPFSPTYYREPGYPLFVASVYQLANNSPLAVVLVQVILLALCAGVAAVVGTHLFGRLPGLIAGALFGLSPEVLHLANQVLSEVLFTLVFLVAMALTLRARVSSSHGTALAAGAALGLSALVRAVAGPLAAPMAVLLALTGAGGRRRALLRAVLFGLAMAIVVAPWVVRNWDATGRPTLTSRFGVNLIRRAPRAAEPLSAYPQWIAVSAWIMANPVSHVVYPLSNWQWGPRPEDNAVFDFHVNDSVRYLKRYDPVCVAARDWEACATEIGLGFVRAYPLQYAVQSVFELVKLHFTPLPGVSALVHNTIVWLAFGTLGVLAWRRRLGRDHLLVIGTVACYLAGSIVLDTQVRYLVPLLPFYAAFAAVPLAAVVVRAQQAVRSRVPAAHQVRA